jgi:nitrogen fixation protein NifU and related proteins
MTASALYHATILEHDRHPRNLGALPEATHQCTLDNPLCGDVVTMRLVVAPAAADPADPASAAAADPAAADPAAHPDDLIAEATFEGRGCALSRASASLWTERIQLRPLAEVRALLERFERFVAEPADAPLPAELGELVALAGVRSVKARRGCATLPSRALAAALAAATAKPPSP